MMVAAMFLFHSRLCMILHCNMRIFAAFPTKIFLFGNSTMLHLEYDLFLSKLPSSLLATFFVLYERLFKKFFRWSSSIFLNNINIQTHSVHSSLSIISMVHYAVNDVFGRLILVFRIDMDAFPDYFILVCGSTNPMLSYSFGFSSRRQVLCLVYQRVALSAVGKR